MKKLSLSLATRARAFTLIELLVVISIIGILAGLILPALRAAKIQAQKAVAKLDMNSLVAAIKQYEGTYNRLPSPAKYSSDVTFGYTNSVNNISGTSVIPTNSNIMVILMDMDISGYANAGHTNNPQQHVFVSPKMGNTQFAPGVVNTVDYQYCDPWGNPYIISLDLNYDDHTRDAVYADPLGLANSVGLMNNGGIYEFSGNVMVWSLGPDKKAAAGVPVHPSDRSGVNYDNVLSWQ